VISIDGTTGEVVVGEARLVEGVAPEALTTVLAWADEIRAGRLGVRANADTGPDAARARQFGAEGIGLCRTEHMFLGDRLPAVRRMILAVGEEAEQAALAELAELQHRDFVEILTAMDGLPVTVRLLDPPLHEFLPDVGELEVAEAEGKLDDEGRALLASARDWREQNPMLGTRGVRLGILRTELFRMQARAVALAWRERRDAGADPRVAIMVPLVVTGTELALVRTWMEETLEEVLGSDREAIPIGTMIETPRAALRADDIAEHAEFFSFGTNDLTQMTFGFSRDDVERRLMSRYLDEGILPRNPFEVIDHRGVGELVAMAAERGRAVRPDLELGVCGEHGGDPTSIAFFAEVGVDYVSCSPYRVPVARLASAQAVLAQDRGGDAGR
jgi:pyruvate,orthophosphate dikinase